ncbi:MAG: Hpt domain-containing protein, partial [Planctomycetota bacterium]
MGFDPSQDPELLNDFITESGELLEQVDRDLVALESTPDDKALLDSVFRAMHTIKGSGGFLALDELCSFTHAAEDALNVLRKGDATLDTATMDLLLEAVDIVRSQVESLAAGEPVEPGPDELVKRLRAVGADPAETTDDAGDGESAEAPAVAGAGTLNLPPNKAELLPFMVDDLLVSLEQIGGMIDSGSDVGAAQSGAPQLSIACEELVRSAAFFELEILTEEINAIAGYADALSSIDAETLTHAKPRAQAIVGVMHDRGEALRDAVLLPTSSDGLRSALAKVLTGDFDGDPPADAAVALAADEQDAADSATESSTDTPAAETGADATSAAVAPATEQNVPTQAAAASNNKPRDAVKPTAEQTIRVDVRRLEALLNMVGELVLQKNRVMGMTRRLGTVPGLDGDMLEDLGQVASGLDRVTAELQLEVMKTRMQPMDKLFSRYPRVIRDLARATGKKIDLQITGAETEVDKSVIEALGDPLVHILRNSADHGIETPEDRAASGKPETGVIRLTAEHDGGSVRVIIRDDG